eukprot:1968098-Rhodomonas_salina.1
MLYSQCRGTVCGVRNQRLSATLLRHFFVKIPRYPGTRESRPPPSQWPSWPAYRALRCRKMPCGSLCVPL